MIYDKLFEKFSSEQVRLSLERSHLIELQGYSTTKKAKEQHQQRIDELTSKIEANKSEMQKLYSKGGKANE